MNETTIREYRFGRCRIVTDSREIYQNDELIAVEPKVFDLLVYLVRHRHRAVSKEELQDGIWGSTIVTEASLTRCVMKARRAVNSGDEAIRTVRGFGYQFSADVDEVTDGASASILPLPSRPSLVVLPFSNLGGNQSEDYFSDGITEDLITELSRFHSLFVIGRHSAFSFKNRSATTEDIARELGVAYVVDGSLQRHGERIRINVRLVDAVLDRQVWAERYDRDLGDVLLIQEEVATTVAATVGGRVEATRGRRRIDGDEFASYDCLLRAQALYYDFAKASNAEARRLLERAIEFDPENARALVLLAAVHSMDSWSFWVEDVDEAQRRSLELGRRSVELDDTDSLALALFAEILWDCGQPELAEHYFQRATTLNPNDIAAHALYASKLGSSGRQKEAIRHIAMAERLDPFGLLWIPLIKSSVMFHAGRYDDAVAAVQSMSRPPNEARYYLIAALGHLGRSDEAAGIIEQLHATAEAEMPNYPGPRLDDWRPLLERIVAQENRAALEHLMDGLREAGFNE